MGSSDELGGGAMIQDVDKTLQTMLLEELKALPGNVIKEASQISFALPSVAEAQKGKKAVVNLYLHDVRENLAMRDTSLHLVKREGVSEGVKQLGPTRLDLSYVVTAHAEGDPELEHRVLSDVISVFLRNRRVPEKYLEESLKPYGPNAVLLSIAQPDHPAHANPSALWTALGGQCKPMLGLVATATFNPNETVVVKLVREALFGIGVGTGEEGPERPIDVRTIRVSAAGIVMDPKTGEPMSGVTVSVAGREEKALTDERGFFYFKNLPSGKHKLVFWKKGFKTTEVETTAPPPGRPDLLEPIGVSLDGLSDRERAEEDRALAESRLNAPGLVETDRRITVTISGRLKYDDGRPASYIAVKCGDKTTMTDREGMYRFTDVPPGRAKVVAEVPGRGDVEVESKDGAAVVPAAR